MDLTPHPVKVVRKEKLASNVVELEVFLLHGFNLSYQAGQYIQFLFDGTFRSYSMVNAPVQNNIRLVFVIELVEDGLAAAFINRLNVGDQFAIRGPYGNFVVGDTNQNLLFVATGVGIAPIMSQITDVLNKKAQNELMLLFGLRNEDNIFYHDILKALELQYSNLTFVPILSKPAGGWQGMRGRVTDILQAKPGQWSSSLAFVCGNQDMVTSVRSLLIEQGMPAENFHQEIFY